MVAYYCSMPVFHFFLLGTNLQLTLCMSFTFDWYDKFCRAHARFGIRAITFVINGPLGCQQRAVCYHANAIFDILSHA